MSETQAKELLEQAYRLQQMTDPLSQLMAGGRFERVRVWCRENPNSSLNELLPRGYQLIPHK